MKKLLIPILILITFSSYSNYYKALLAPQPANADSIGNLKKANRYFILRNGSESFAMNNVSISTDQKYLQCNLETVPNEHRLYINNGTKGKMNYRKSDDPAADEMGVLNEVHIYITPESNILAGPYTLALQKVLKAEIIEKDKVKTKRNHTIGLVVGISSAVVVIAAVVAIIPAIRFTGQ